MGEPNDDPPPFVEVESIYETMAIQNVVASGDRYECEVEHPDFGWMPFTADANDPEVGARRIYERIVAEL